jgi:hypothetical protein
MNETKLGALASEIEDSIMPRLNREMFINYFHGSDDHFKDKFEQILSSLKKREKLNEYIDLIHDRIKLESDKERGEILRMLKKDSTKERAGALDGQMTIFELFTAIIDPSGLSNGIVSNIAKEIAENSVFEVLEKEESLRIARNINDKALSEKGEGGMETYGQESKIKDYLTLYIIEQYKKNYNKEFSFPNIEDDIAEYNIPELKGPRKRR